MPNSRVHNCRYIRQSQVSSCLRKTAVVYDCKKIFIFVIDFKQDCNQFQAGTNLRSKIKSNKLDETAVFGCACRHEVPKKCFSLKRGEQ